MANGKMLVFTLTCDGRGIPFFTKVVPKKACDGAPIRPENEGLEAVGRMCGDRRDDIVVVADRGFGNKRWLGAVVAQGFHFLQRLSCVFFVETEHFIGHLRELDLRRGRRVRDWGRGVIGEAEAIHGRLVTAYDPKAKEPWFLVSDLHEIPEQEVVTVYRLRWCIETLFRDKKNRDWGLGLAQVKSKDYRRYERLFYIVALAFIFLSAHGVAAEHEGFDRGLKANTRKTRMLNLLRTDYYYIKQRGHDFEYAVAALRNMATLIQAPNWG